jgi:hypothetical protein
MVFFKSMKLALMTGGISQITGFIALYATKSPIFSLIWIQLFGNIISYMGQSYAFGFREIRSEILIRWCISVAFSLILNIKIYNTLVDIKKLKDIRKYIDDHYSDLVTQLYDFAIITLSIMIVFIICLYPLRKYYIFVNRNQTENHNIDLILLFGLYIYFYFDKIYKDY